MNESQNVSSSIVSFICSANELDLNNNSYMKLVCINSTTKQKEDKAKACVKKGSA